MEHQEKLSKTRNGIFNNFRLISFMKDINDSLQYIAYNKPKKAKNKKLKSNIAKKSRKLNRK